MAFLDGTTPCKCWECKKVIGFFRMFQSYRPEHIEIDEDTNRVFARLFCVECEVRVRTDEMNHFFTVEQRKEAGKQYATTLQVQRDLKAKNRESWYARASHVGDIKSSMTVETGNPEVTFIQCLKVMQKNYFEDSELSPGASASVTPPAERGILAAGGGEGEAAKKIREQIAGRSIFVGVDVQGEGRISCREMKKFVLIKSKALTRGLVGMLRQQAPTLSALLEAGRWRAKSVEVFNRLEEANARWMESDSAEDYDRLEALEYEYEKAQVYSTASEHGLDQRVKYLKVSESGGNICDGWRNFYCCRAGGAGNNCGLAFPSKLWFQKDRKTSCDPSKRRMPGNWKFMCFVAWEYLQEEAVDDPEGAAFVLYKEMLERFGRVGRFPHVGCGANYVPWAKGPSVVCEVLIGNTWEAFLADHTPAILTDLLERVSYLALSRAVERLNPQLMFKAIPMTMPMTRWTYYENKEVEVVARFPIDAWVTAGHPSFTTQRWGMICMAIAEQALAFDDLAAKDREVFEALFNVSKSLAPTP